MAGQEGFEPPTPGFGVRCSTVRATGLHIRLYAVFREHIARRLLRFLVQSVFATFFTMFFDLQLCLDLFLVLVGEIVLVATFLTLLVSSVMYMLTVRINYRIKKWTGTLPEANKKLLTANKS